MGLSHSPNIVTDGLVLCLDAANRRSYPGAGTTWTDLSGNGNHGTLTNGPVFNGGFEGMSFDGSNDYVTCLSPVSDAPISLSLWVNFQSLLSAQAVLGVADTIGTASFLKTINIIYLPPQKVQGGLSVFVWDDAPPYQIARPLTPFSTSGSWTHVFVIVSKSGTSYSVQMFVNGVEGATDTGSGAGFVFNEVLIGIAKREDGALLYPLGGRVDDICIYNRALSANEVQQNYNATRWRFQ